MSQESRKLRTRGLARRPPRGPEQSRASPHSAGGTECGQNRASLGCLCSERSHVEPRTVATAQEVCWGGRRAGAASCYHIPESWGSGLQTSAFPTPLSLTCLGRALINATLPCPPWIRGPVDLPQTRGAGACAPSIRDEPEVALRGDRTSWSFATKESLGFQ